MPTTTRWQSVASAVAAALSVPPNQWSRVLGDALKGDASGIRQARVLLQHHANAASFLEAAPSLPLDRQQLEAGMELGGRYLIEARLGAGAMGEVYQALDRDLNQHVALKVISPSYSPDASSRDRLRRELKLGRQVRNGNVCQLFDVMTVESPAGPLLVLTMELLKGETLDAILSREPLLETHVRQIAEGVLNGLAAAHAEGILHGDLKCSNVIVRSADESGLRIPVITDFGLARRLGPSPVESIRIDDDNVIMGTPAYMAPEQILGKPLTETADLHAFGVVLFRMVTGRLPFDAPNAQEVLALRVHSDAPNPRDFAPELSPSLERTITACLARDPRNRPRDVAEIRAMLGGAARRHPRGAAMLVAAALALIAVIAYGLSGVGRAGELDANAQTHLKLGEEFLARRGNGDFEQAISEFRQVTDIAANRPEGWIGLAEAYSGAANWGAMDNAEGLRQARETIERAVQVAPDDSRVQSLLGYIASIDVERWLTAEPYFVRALELNAHDEKAQFWYATHLGRLGHQDEAIALLTRVLASSPQSFSIQHQLAMEYFRAGRNAQFLTHATQLARIQPNLPNSRLTLARALVQNGRLEEAAAECVQAEKFNADRSQLLAVLAVVQQLRGELEAARQSRAELERLWNARPTNSNGVAAAFAMAGDATTAVKYLESGFNGGDSLVLAAHVTPWFHPIKNTSEFVAFVRKTGLRPSS